MPRRGVRQPYSPGETRRRSAAVVLDNARSPSPEPPRARLLPQLSPRNPYDPRTAEGLHRIQRRDDPSLPTRVDRFIDANLTSWLQRDPRLISTTLLPEEVTCEVEMVFEDESLPADPRDPFIDAPARWTLFLTILMGDHSGIRPGLRRSPRAILESCEWTVHPEWAECMDNGQIYRFTQPRCVVTDAFAMLATSHDNIARGYSPAMLRWASQTSYVRQARRALHGPRRENVDARGGDSEQRRSARLSATSRR